MFTDTLRLGQAIPSQLMNPLAPTGPVPAPIPLPKPTAPVRFDASDLYGPTGKPTQNDIQQNAFGDCYYVATLAAVAQQQPSRIQDAISFDARTGNFTVTLYDKSGNPQQIEVTQAEIASNIQRQGGSTADNTKVDDRIWPDVMEVAYAKQLDTNHADGIEQGYTDLADGGWPQDAMQAVTGDRGGELRYNEGFFESGSDARDRLANQVNAALGNGRPVTLWSVPENRSIWDKLTGSEGTQDGLVDNHVYSVESVTKDSNGDWQVTLRNPWATNAGVEGGTSTSATITVPLETLVETGGLEAFTAGPAN